MSTMRRGCAALVAAAGIAVAVAPVAVAEPDSTIPQCVNVGGSTAEGGQTTECGTPGNVQLNATPPVDQPDYPYPYDDEFYGPALIFGGPGFHGGGGGGGHR
jgi:hypothetical protein